MSLGSEFRLHAIPTQEQMRRLLYLAEQDNGSVLAPGARDGRTGGGHSRGADRAMDDITAVMSLNEATEAVTRAAISRINHDLDIADEAAARTLEEIRRQLAENAARRQEALDNAYRDESGRALFLSEDGESVYDEYGNLLSPEEAAALPIDELKNHTSWDAFGAYDKRSEELLAEAERVEDGIDRRQEIRDRVAGGQLSLEELEALELEIDATIAPSMQTNLEAVRAERGDPPPVADEDAPEPAENAADADTQHHVAGITLPELGR